MAFGEKLYSLKDVKVTSILGTSQADLPAARRLGLKLRMAGRELRGDDGLAAVLSQVIAADWELEAGGINFATLVVMTNKTITNLGVSPNRSAVIALTGLDQLPYFKIYGQSVGEGADDVHVKLYKCKIKTLEGEFGAGEFYITHCSGVAVEDGVNGVIGFVQHETAVSVPGN